MAIGSTPVQQVTATHAGSQSSLTVTPAATAAGSLLVALFTLDTGATKNVASISDNVGATWVLAHANAKSGTAGRVELWYALDVPAGITSVTATYSGSVSSGGVNLTEWGGVGALDQSATTVNSMVTRHLTGLTTASAQAGSLAIGGVAFSVSGAAVTLVDQAASSPSSGWTPLSDVVSGGGAQLAGAYHVGGGAGQAYQAAFTIDQSETGGGAIVVFSPAATEPTQYPLSLATSQATLSRVTRGPQARFLSATGTTPRVVRGAGLRYAVLGASVGAIARRGIRRLATTAEGTAQATAMTLRGLLLAAVGSGVGAVTRQTRSWLGGVANAVATTRHRVTAHLTGAGGTAASLTRQLSRLLPLRSDGILGWAWSQSGTTRYQLWPDSTTPAILQDNDPLAVNLGTRFRSSQAGTVTGARFYKATGNTGPHTASLYTASGTLLTQQAFGPLSGQGWREVSFASPVAINANTDYVIAYHTASGNYSASTNYFDTSYSNAPLTAPAATGPAPNGVYLYSSNSGFPNQTWQNTNYWVDVILEVGGAGGSGAHYALPLRAGSGSRVSWLSEIVGRLYLVLSAASGAVAGITRRGLLSRTAASPTLGALRRVMSIRRGGGTGSLPGLRRQTTTRLSTSLGSVASWVGSRLGGLRQITLATTSGHLTQITRRAGLRITTNLGSVVVWGATTVGRLVLTLATTSSQVGGLRRRVGIPLPWVSQTSGTLTRRAALRRGASTVDRSQLSRQTVLRLPVVGVQGFAAVRRWVRLRLPVGGTTHGSLSTGLHRLKRRISGTMLLLTDLRGMIRKRGR